jgi:hypothetical protein
MSETTGKPPFSEPTRAYGPVEQADDTRQAQQTQSNDTPTDVNMNAVVARSQSLTFDTAGKNYEAGADRRRILADSILAAFAPKAT